MKGESVTDFPRPLTAQEIEWLTRAITLEDTYSTITYSRNAEEIGKPIQTHEELPKDVQVGLLAQISSLRVVSQCACEDPRCHTVSFREYQEGEGLWLAFSSDAWTDDGRMIIAEWDEQHRLVGLEVI